MRRRHTQVAAAASGVLRGAQPQAEAGCEWLEGSFELPDLPALPSDARFQLPPIPQLVPTWQQLQSLSRVPEPRATHHSEHHSHKGNVAVSAAGVALGGATLLSLCVGLFVSRTRCQSRLALMRDKAFHSSRGGDISSGSEESL